MSYKDQTIKYGDCCPVCGCCNIESSSAANFDTNTVDYDVYCLKCEAEWTEHYKMHGVTITKKSK